MSLSYGTGIPITLRCSKCKKYRDWQTEHKKGTNLEATGRTKERQHCGALRMQTTAVEYRCLDCGHVGWSQHVDAMRHLKMMIKAAKCTCPEVKLRSGESAKCPWCTWSESLSVKK